MIDWLRGSRPKPEGDGTATRTVRVGAAVLPLRIRKLRHARRITLRLAPDGSEARVTLPPWGRIGEAEAFARERSDWLQHQLARVPRAQRMEPGALLPYRGERLPIAWSPTAPRKPVLDNGEVVLGGPQAAVESRLKRWLESEALRLSSADIEEYARDAGVAIPRVLLSRAARRWGSCTASGIVRLNWRLVMAPDFVRRSVAAHEIAHLVHFDHSPAFHAFLDELYEGEIADANRWLKRHGRTLYAVFA